MNNNFKKLFMNMAFILLFGGIVSYFVLKDNVSAVLVLLQHADAVRFGVVVGSVLLSQGILGLILKQLTCLSKTDYTWKEGLINGLVASFFHGITPGASGGQVAQMVIFKKQHVPLSDSASILWMDFILYQSSMVLTVFVLFLLRFHEFFAYRKSLSVLIILGFFVNAAVILGLWMLAHMKKFYTWISTKGLEIGVFFHLIHDREQALLKLNEQLERFASEVVRLKSHRRVIVQVMMLNAVRQVVLYSVPALCAWTLGIKIQFCQWIDMMALSSFVAMVNCFLPIPGSSGGTEATFVSLFSILFTKAEATSIMFLWRFASFYLILIIGGLTFLMQKFHNHGGEREEQL